MSTEQLRLAAARARLTAGVVGYALGASPRQIMGDSRGPQPTASARNVVMYLLYAAFGMSQAEVAAALGRDRSTVGHGVRQVEERREDARFDGWLSQLEACLRAAPEPRP